MKKCLNNSIQIKLLGHLVGNGVVKLVDPKHVAALNDLQQSTKKKELQ